ncbi:MAG: HAMP domain-containing protein [Rivularia sp. (in: Bacteria)]|nr:HAMP domain-containing protein [Rivularia sp. MS3]
MLGINRLSIKSKLQIMMLVASLGSIVVVGYLSWNKAQETLTERIFNQLTSVRASKAYQIESYFQTLRNHVETLCEDRMVVEAMSEFNQAYTQLNQQSIAPDWNQQIAAYYNNEFLPRLAKNTTGTPLFATYRPKTTASQYLQYHYIAGNPNPVGEKDELRQAADGSQYSNIHARYHRLFRNLIKKFGYYDLFLIDSKTGNIVYSVYKETDFGMSLDEKPLSSSNLAEVVRKVRANPDRGAVQIVDFKFYRPSYNAPAAFFAGAIYDGDKEVGILAVQLPVDEINIVLTGNRRWKQDGLGNTGETFLIGSDLLMRSVARPLLENPQAYLTELSNSNVNKDTLDQIKRLKTSILVQKVDNTVARAAISGKSGTQKAKDYLNKPTLSSYSPVDIKGVNWGIIADMQLSEAYEPINELQFYLLASSIILVLLVLFYAIVAAQRFIQPIDTLIASSSKVKAGKLDTQVVFNSKDEFNELAQIFNSMVGQLRGFNALVEQKTQENENLLLSILPEPVFKRFQQDDKHVINYLQQLTIVSIRIGSLTKNSFRDALTETNWFNELINALDEIADKNYVERLSIFGDSYIACCGLTKARLDSVNCVVEFALEALNIVKRFNQKHNISLNLRVGIHTGAVMAAIVGKQKFRYQLWGETLDIANLLQQNAEPNTILVTTAVYERLSELYSFTTNSMVYLDEYQLPTWILHKTILSKSVGFEKDTVIDSQTQEQSQTNSKY